MEKFDKLEGVAAPLRIVNVDTDMIIPKQYLKTLKRTGLAKGLFSELRYKDDGSENPDFVLNKPAYRKAKIIVADNNFGCGSSREHAPWALMDYGIRCVISTQFGDIFYNNCFKNGVLPIKVSPEDLEKLFDDAERGANATLSIDLEKQEIRGPDGGVVKFDIDPHRKHCHAQRARRHRPDQAEADQDRQLRGKVQGRAAVGLRPSRALVAGALTLALAFPAGAAPRSKTRFDGIRDCERLAAVQFKRHNPVFRRFVIDRAAVEDDKYADNVGPTFVSTIYHGKATYEAAKGPQPTRFICLHGGVGKDAVFVYTLPAS